MPYNIYYTEPSKDLKLLNPLPFKHIRAAVQYGKIKAKQHNVPLYGPAQYHQPVPIDSHIYIDTEH